MLSSPAGSARHVLIDAHVHFYPGFDASRFFDAAAANFRRAERDLALAQRALGCLLLAETAHDHFFARLAAGTVRANGWSFGQTGEDRALMARRQDGAELLLGAGRQIRSIDDLEVLALGTTQQYSDTLRFVDAFEAALTSAGAVVLPWGFGKWWFRRRAIVRDAIRSFPDRRFFLGDNGGRLSGSPRPALLDEGERAGHWNLPGSDPLPLVGEDRRAGSYGCLIETALDPARPLASVVTALHASPAPPRTYGSRTPIHRFCIAQFRLQVRKRVQRR